MNNRPEIAAQRKLKELANKYLKVAYLKVPQDTVNNHLQSNIQRRSKKAIAWGISSKNGKDKMVRVAQMVDLRVKYSKTPNIYDHIEDAIEKGNPDKLTKNSALSEGNRSDAAKSYFGTSALFNESTGLYSFPKAGDGMSWDEYPFACTEEGGTDSSLREVPIKEQNIQGGQLSSIPNGKFNVILDDE